jgi:ribonuclease HII
MFMVGVDEVGRGCLAGPLLVVAARAAAELPDSLADSKILTRAQREEFLALLINVCQFGEGWVSSKEIDDRGLTAAMKLGVARALKQLQVDINEDVVMDGPFNYLPKKYANVLCLIDADALIPLVSAASIYAKVKRDNFMRQLQKQYPDYGFENHVGYGTPAHRLALKKFGSLPRVHRQSFRPLRGLAV